jgi:hypothetical protein
MGMRMIPVDMEDLENDHEDGGEDGIGQNQREAVLALVSPFEGGGEYVLDAVKKVAEKVRAEILTFDLALGLGLSGPAAPLASTGELVCRVVMGFKTDHELKVKLYRISLFPRILCYRALQHHPHRVHRLFRITMQ